MAASKDARVRSRADNAGRAGIEEARMGGSQMAVGGADDGDDRRRGRIDEVAITWSSWK